MKRRKSTILLLILALMTTIVLATGCGDKNRTECRKQYRIST